MTGTLVLDPLLPMIAIWVLCALATCGVALAIWRRLSGWWLRGLAAFALLAALANPSLQQEERIPLSDIIVMVVDESASQRISDRADQNAQVIANMQDEVAGMDNTELRVVTLSDGEGDSGTTLMTALSEALAEEPQGRIAGTILVTDGRVHDIDRAPNMVAPTHTILTGRSTDWDRRLIVKEAPAFAIMGEPVTLSLQVVDQGNAPDSTVFVPLSISIDGGQPQLFEVPLDQNIELPIDLPHGARRRSGN